MWGGGGFNREACGLGGGLGGEVRVEGIAV